MSVCGPFACIVRIDNVLTALPKPKYKHTTPAGSGPAQWIYVLYIAIYTIHISELYLSFYASNSLAVAASWWSWPSSLLVLASFDSNSNRIVIVAFMSSYIYAMRDILFVWPRKTFCISIMRLVHFFLPIAGSFCCVFFCCFFC